MTKKEFEVKLEESKHHTCGNINKETYYDYLSKITIVILKKLSLLHLPLED